MTSPAASYFYQSSRYLHLSGAFVTRLNVCFINKCDQKSVCIYRKTSGLRAISIHSRCKINKRCARVIISPPESILCECIHIARERERQPAVAAPAHWEICVGQTSISWQNFARSVFSAARPMTMVIAHCYILMRGAQLRALLLLWLPARRPMCSRKFLPIYRGRNYYFHVCPSPAAVTQERGIKIIKTQIYTQFKRVCVGRICSAHSVVYFYFSKSRGCLACARG